MISPDERHDENVFSLQDGFGAREPHTVHADEIPVLLFCPHREHLAAALLVEFHVRVTVRGNKKTGFPAEKQREVEREKGRESAREGQEKKGKIKEKEIDRKRYTALDQP